MAELFQIFFKWKKHILGLSILAIVLSSIITMPAIMPPYFETKMVFYVTNPQSTDRANLFNQENAINISMFGNREDADRFIAVAKSSSITQQIIEKYKLNKHYKIKQKTKALEDFYTYKEYASLVEIQRNDADAIEVSVLDTDAQLAADIAKDIVHLSEKKVQQIILENKQKVLEQIEQLIAENSKVSNTNTVAIENMEKFKDLRNQYSISVNNDFKTIYIIEDAYVSPKKSKPVRWQIVLFSCIITFATALLFAIVYEQVKHANK